jgi:uncharacterized protein YjaG (DUF416 family)
MRMTPFILYNTQLWNGSHSSLSKDFVLVMIPWTAAFIYVGVHLEGIQDLFASIYDLGPYTGVYVVMGACTAIMMMLVVKILKSKLSNIIEVECVSISMSDLFHRDMFE